MVLASDLKNIYKHPAITSCQDISEIMLPLLKKHEITVFNYYKYTDEGIVRLSTHQKWTEHYFKKGYVNTSTVPTTYLQNRLNYFIWMIDDCPEMLKDAALNFDISNGISIAIKSKNATEFYGFGTTLNNTSIINNFYLNNLDKLLAYCHYFKDHGRLLLKKCEKEKIILVPAEKTLINKTLSKNKLTHRQRDCALYLLEGMKYREIASKLNLSQRTIETHIEHLKTKLKCHNKTELILKLSKIPLEP